jgi:glycosyltransferase involved in cell wall biosynthesis
MTRSNGTTGWQEYIKTKWLKQAQQVISCSEAIRRRCWPPSLVIGNPYKEDTFKILGSIEKTSDFIFLGRLVSDKGADLAIRAFHQLLLRKRIDFNSPTTLMTIVGEGPERQTLEKLVFELGLQKKVLFKGALLGRELVECLNQHRFLVVPSLWEEPFGLVALEGMACGCLPIVSDGGGLPDAVGKAGIVFKRGDLDSLVDCMFKVFEDEKLVNHIRTAATSHLASHTSFEVSKRYLNVVQSIFKKQSALDSKSN